jgi:undecaprenyl-diphosphatase
VKVARDWERIAGPLLRDFTIAFGASFVTAALIVGPFVRFLQHHTFRPFAYYRIVAGGVLWAMIGSGLV